MLMQKTSSGKWPSNSVLVNNIKSTFSCCQIYSSHET